MGIDALGDVTARMAEDATFRRLVRAGIIKQRRYRMPAVVGCMTIGTDKLHDRAPDGAVTAVIIRPAGVIGDKRITWTYHARFDKRQDAMMYRNDADTGRRFAPCDADITLTQMHVRFL